MSFWKSSPPPPPSDNKHIIAVSGIVLALGTAALKFIVGKLTNDKLTPEERREKEEQARLRKEKEAERLRLQREEEEKRKREEYKRKLNTILATAWWNIPEGKILLIDTCVWMEGAEKNSNICQWLQWMLQHAVQRNWSIMLEHSVIQEIERRRKNCHKSRRAHAIIRTAQKELLPHKLFIWENASVPYKQKDATAYADPELVQRMKTCDNIILITLDYSLAMTAKQIIGDVNRVCDLDNFVPIIKQYNEHARYN